MAELCGGGHEVDDFTFNGRALNRADADAVDSADGFGTFEKLHKVCCAVVIAPQIGSRNDDFTKAVVCKALDVIYDVA